MLSPLTFDVLSAGDRDFETILSLRRQAYGRPEAGIKDSYDEYSYHLVARQHDEIVAAIRVTCVKDGPLMSMERYPAWILDAFGDSLLAGSRLCVSRRLSGSGKVPQMLLRYAWQQMLPLGMLANVAVARVEAIPFYMRQGFVFVRDSLFHYDRWSTLCGLIAVVADSRRPSPYADVFRSAELPPSFPNLEDPQRFISSFKEFRALTQTAA